MTFNMLTVKFLHQHLLCRKDIYSSGLSINHTFAFHLLHECAAIRVPVRLNMEISCHAWKRTIIYQILHGC